MKSAEKTINQLVDQEINEIKKHIKLNRLSEEYLKVRIIQLIEDIQKME